LGSALFQQGNTQEAIEYLRKATQMSPSFLDAQIELAKALRSIGDPSADEEWQKVELLDTLIGPNRRKSLRRLRQPSSSTTSRSLMQEGKAAAAIKAFQAALKLEPNLVEAHHALGCCQCGRVTRRRQEGILRSRAPESGGCRCTQQPGRPAGSRTKLRRSH